MIKENLEQLNSNLPEGATLVAVSKTKPNDLIQEAYDAGQRIFGENRVQELVDKSTSLPDDIQWHMIGHLQSKKVKSIAPFIALIHSVDSFKLLAEINKQAEKNGKVQNCLFQFHIAEERTKFGFDLSEVEEILDSSHYSELSNIRICGVMGMATFTSDQRQVREEFSQLKKTFDWLKEGHFADSESFKIISMGMSGDYEIAISEGSNMIRVGSSIFGSRN